MHAGVSLVLTMLFVIGHAPAAMAATVANGGFETGSFTGWTLSDQPNGSGSWFVYSGTAAPLSGLTIPAPPQGAQAATTDQGGPGSHVLYQDVALEPASTHTLSFTLAYENRAGLFSTPASLDFTDIPNQQFRIDIMQPSAPVASVAAGDVLAAVFQTRVGDPASLAPTVMSFDLSPFAGRTLRIRFAEVDNQDYFRAQVDAVGIVSTRLCDQTLTGTVSSAVNVTSGVTCVTDASVGSVTVQPGAAVHISDSTVHGGIISNGAASVRLCGSQVGGSVSVSDSTGFVLIGDPGDDACPGNTIGGSVTLGGNHGGAEIITNKTGGTVTVTGTTGTGPFGEDDRAEIEANAIAGGLNCSTNARPPTSEGEANAVAGAMIGQCSSRF